MKRFLVVILLMVALVPVSTAQIPEAEPPGWEIGWEVEDDIVIFEGELNSLRRFKEDVNEVKNGNECGMGIKNYKDIKPGDKIEVFDRKEEAQQI